MIKAEWTNKDALDLQPTCNKLATTEGNLISREGAIECIRWGESVTDVIDRIKLLPSAEPKTDGVLEQIRWERDVALKTLEEHGIGFGEKPKTGEWIPVSEKPKDEERTYLVQLDSGGMRSCRWTNANPFWTELTTDWHWNMFDIPQYCNVVAWMDLEPYKGGDDNEID